MKKTVKIAVNVVAWIIVVLAVLMTLLVFTSQSKAGVGDLLGIIPVTIQSDSMAPTFKKGDLIIDKKTDADAKLQKGDIITFWTLIDNQKVLNTHRIEEVKEVNSLYMYTTKGDNNTTEDSLTVYPADIVAKYNGIRIPGAGNVLDFLKTSTGFLVCIVLPLILFFLYELYRFISVVVTLKKPKLTLEQEEELKQKAIEEYLAAQKQQEESAELKAADEKDKIEINK